VLLEINFLPGLRVEDCNFMLADMRLECTLDTVIDLIGGVRWCEKEFVSIFAPVKALTAEANLDTLRLCFLVGSHCRDRRGTRAEGEDQRAEGEERYTVLEVVG
jgi:hypothetical protein